MINSPGFRDHVTKHGARKVEIIPNGADATMFDPEGKGSKFRIENNLEGKFIALYAGAHGLSNDLGIVLEAANLLVDRPDIAIVFVGDGKEKPALQARAQEFNLTNVRFIPPVPKLTMSDVLAAADSCIAILKPISLYSTVYPNKVFDYMAAGRPVILAITGVIREVVETAKAGVSIDPGDPLSLANAIRYLADHTDESRLMGLNGRYCIETQFDRPILGEKLYSLLNYLKNN
jgi:glycosyltransferase involved in cell wall biosynthesis